MATNLQGQVHIRVKENVSLQNLNEIVAGIVRMTGCTHCGLLGVDLRLTGDPVEFAQIQKLPGVQSAEFIA